MNTPNRQGEHTLGTLEAVALDPKLSQRRLAKHLGVALGLANSYLKRCIHKGWIKVAHAPGNRYLYYLTPRGFAEKSRLTATYLSVSLKFYRNASESVLKVLRQCSSDKKRRLVLVGVSELAEVAVIQARGEGLTVAGLVTSAKADGETFSGVFVYDDPRQVSECDAWIITDLEDPVSAWERIRRHAPENSVLVPDILEWRQEKLP